jgi:hypothetical protein
LVERLNKLCVARGGLSGRKVGMRLLPDRNGRRPAKQSEGKAGQSKQGTSLLFRASQKSMRRRKSGPDQQACRTQGPATLTAPWTAEQPLLLEFAQKHSQIILYLPGRNAVILGNPCRGSGRAICQRLLQHLSADRWHRVEAT